MKKLFCFMAVFFLSYFVFTNVALAVDKVVLKLFYSETCSHCAKEEIFLEQLAEKYPDLEIQKYEVSKDGDNQRLFKQTGKELNVDTSGVPFTVIDEKYFIGYLSDATTGAEIEKAVRQALNSTGESDSKMLTLPLFGTVDLGKISLPALTVAIAFLDGFNPCAMWVLLFLISLLIGTKDRVKMWVLGLVFIATSSAVYFLFLAAWLNFFLVISFISWVRIIIAFVALGAAVYYLWDYVRNKGVCKLVDARLRSTVFDKARKVVGQKSLVISLIGVVVLAISVNMIELVCSAGLPAVYTQVLSLSGLPAWQYYSYLVLYVLIFMVDDLVVFFIAMVTLQATGINANYSKYSRFIGGIILLIIGILMLVKPELLAFKI